MLSSSHKFLAQIFIRLKIIFKELLPLYSHLNRSMKMRKMIWSKLRSPFRKEGRYREEHVTSLVKKPNVDEEYVEVLRTKSYIDICHKVEVQLETKSLDEPCSSSSSLPQHVHLLSEFVLEPRQELLNNMIKNSDLHLLLINYFENSLEACRICELLIRSIHQTRANYRTINRVMTQMKRTTDDAECSNDLCHAVYRELASFGLLKNPLSTISPVQFQTIHDGHVVLLHELTSKCRKIRRRRRIIRFFHKAMASMLVGVCTVSAIVLLVLAVHSGVGMVAAPSLIASSIILIKKFKLSKQALKTTRLERLEAQLDVAAKGVYIQINDFDTISRLVMRLCDEMDHNKSIVEMCVRKGNKEMLKEVTREFQINETRFLEQLQELEEGLYLCFLNINRSRRLVVEKGIGC